MAGAEARALWQRTANRCFVQEDAKRAPKLACCQSSCATSKLVDAGPANTADESDRAAVNVIRLSRGGGLQIEMTHTQGSLDSGVMHKKQVPSANEGLLYFASDKSSSYTPLHEDVRENQQIFVGDSGKAQLMEATVSLSTRCKGSRGSSKKSLRTRERTHCCTHFLNRLHNFLRISNGFNCYRLETLCSQIKNKDQPISTLLPVALPWMSYER
ncbi:hypothetical protein SESBI_19250 [Sesbania bispinosa]|nr:hypothetical protein SESBI_19250 [Sesbania bispinosa]